MASRAFLTGLTLILLIARSSAQMQRESYRVMGAEVFTYRCEGSARKAAFGVPTTVSVERYCWIGSEFARRFVRNSSKRELRANPVNGLAVDCHAVYSDSCGSEISAARYVAISAN